MVRKVVNFFVFFLALLLIGAVIYHHDLIYRILAYRPTHPYEKSNQCLNPEPFVIDAFEYQTKIGLARDKVEQIKQNYHIPALNICVAKSGQIIWNEALGCTNLETLTAATVEDSYRIGSLSKSLSAIALVNLVEQGKIELDLPIQQYSPNCPIETPITLRQLAAHQSSIRHYQGLEMFSNQAYKNIEESLVICSQDNLLFPPGTDFRYSTYGYTMLAWVIEKITQMDFVEYVLTEICPKLGMKQTRLESSTDYQNCYAAHPAEATIKRAIKIDLSNKIAGGGFMATSKDLVNMLINLDSLISPITQKELFTPQAFIDGSLGKQNYGLGFRVYQMEDSNKTFIHHGGTSVGGRSFLFKAIEDDIVIAVCTNSHSSIIQPQDFGLQEIYDIAKIFTK